MEEEKYIRTLKLHINNVCHFWNRIFNGCKPISIWTLIRHGRRNPGIDFGRNMLDALVIRDYVVKSYESGNSTLCAQDVDNLRDWEVRSDLFENRHSLTHEGYMEIQGIGKRLKEAYRELLTDLQDGSYILRPAYAYWVEKGVEGFVEGISDKQLVVENPNPQYDIMAPYESCSSYMINVRRNPHTFLEADKYLNSTEFMTTKERIQKRLGIRYILTDTNITSLYDLCRYTSYGIDNKVSPWCALFTKEDLRVIEYHGDLKHYYRNGYGVAMNEKFGQIPMADLFKTFVDAKNGSGRKLTAYFSHATMMDMVYTALGWFKDKNPLKSTNRDQDRKWRSAKLAPFASNLIVVLNRCSEDGDEDYKVVFYTNEQRITSICGDGVWSWRKFERKFKGFLNTTMDFCNK